MAENKQIKLLTKFKSFFNDLDTKKIMNYPVLFLKETDDILKAKKIMKEKKISGIPIVDNDMKLINIVSTEDIINALENNIINEKIEKMGRKKVISIKENFSFEKIVNIFANYEYGRYPVVKEDNTLVGIITNKDLLFAVLSKLSILYLHDERRREILDSPLSIFIQNMSEEYQFEYEIDNEDVNHSGEGSALLKSFLKAKKFDKSLIRKISIATYEAEVNVVIHAGGRGRIKTNITNDCITIYIEDTGKGIENIEKAMEPGFSTAPEFIRGLGFGAGMGLPNIKRFADKLVITSEKNKGTNVEMLFWIDKITN